MSGLLATSSDAELLAALRELEAELCRVQFQQLSVLAELSARNVPGALGLRGLADLIAAQVRCTRTEARKRARAVERFGARQALTGESLEPVYPATAEALGDGEISPEHGVAIADTVERIPVSDRAEHAAAVETTLLEHARSVDPRTVKLLGQRILAHLDPDGPSPDAQRLQQAHRQVNLNRLPDSTGLLDGRLTPTCQAIWEAILTPLAARRPDDALGPDDRTPGQRMHDAFEEAGRRLLKAGELPDHAGLPAQLIITLTLTDLERRAGRATTHHGGTLSVDQALKLAADGKALPAILDDVGGILAYGRGQRLASAGQRKALFARDRGCTFPGCTRTAAQSEIHHTTDWARGGRTDLKTMAIACGYHNNEGPKQGWHTVMIDQIPHWQPPPWHPVQEPNATTTITPSCSTNQRPTDR